LRDSSMNAAGEAVAEILVRCARATPSPRPPDRSPGLKSRIPPSAEMTESSSHQSDKNFVPDIASEPQFSDLPSIRVPKVGSLPTFDTVGHQLVTHPVSLPLRNRTSVNSAEPPHTPSRFDAAEELWKSFSLRFPCGLHSATLRKDDHNNTGMSFPRRARTAGLPRRQLGH